MIAFTYGEIVSSILLAILYGCLYAVLFSLVCLIVNMVLSLPKIIRDTLSFDKILPPPSFKNLKTDNSCGGFLSFICVILFTIGFLLLSYLALDGVIRIYMLILSFASFYLSKITFTEFLSRLFMAAFRRILSLLSIVVRVVIWPLKRLFYMLFRLKEEV